MNADKISPTGARLLIEERDDDERTTESGLVMLGQWGNYKRGRIVAVGPGEIVAEDGRSITVTGVAVAKEMRVGDEVLFEVGEKVQPLMLNSKRHYLLNERAVAARIAP